MHLLYAWRHRAPARAATCDFSELNSHSAFSDNSTHPAKHHRPPRMLTKIDLTPANRPQLLPDETLLFVQNSVGLYEG